MVYLEACLIAILVLLFVYTSISDLKTGRIGNKTLLISLCPGAICAAAYYGFFASDCLPAYGINVGVALIICILLYSMGIWGAGDSKLMTVTVLLFPARLYCLGDRSMASCFFLVALIFIVSFLYVIIDTVYLGIRQKDLFKIRKARIDWKSYIKGFLFFFLALGIINAVLAAVLPEKILSDSLLITSFHFIFILICLKLENKANWIVVAVMGAVWAALLISGISRFDPANINWRSYLIVVALILFRLFADKYNYKTIRVNELKPGMILAASSVIAFSGSRVAGLPSRLTEDLKSRLTPDEVESINRWSKSKYGKDTITVVRKIPFALFISVGTVIFAILEVTIK